MRIVLLALTLLLAIPATASATSTVRLARGGPLVAGSDAADRIVVSAADEGRTFVIEDPAGLTIAGEGCQADGSTRARCPRIVEPTECDGDSCSQLVSGVTLNGGAGDDDLRVGYGDAAATWPQSHAFLDGGLGNDFLGGTPVVDYELAGGPGDDVIDGAGFNDRLIGGGGRDRLYGGPGIDTLTDGDGPPVITSRADPDVPVDADVLDGGPCPEPVCAPAGPAESGDAEDTVSYENRERPVTVNLRRVTATQGQRGERDTVRNVERIFGGRGGDRLTVGRRPGGVLSGRGNDVVDARGDGRTFVNCEEGGYDTVAADRRDMLVDCPTRCRTLEGCPRPRLTVSGVPRRCARRSFRATIVVRGVPRIHSVSATFTGRRFGPARGRRLRVTLPVRRGTGGTRRLTIVAARRGGPPVVLHRDVETCAP